MLGILSHPQWPLICNRTGMMSRYLLILLALLMVCSLGAFFLAVTILPVVVATAFIMMLCGMFWVGLYLGQNPRVAIVQRNNYQPPEWSFPKRTAQVQREYRTAA
jgi:hypothetical protein